MKTGDETFPKTGRRCLLSWRATSLRRYAGGFTRLVLMTPQSDAAEISIPFSLVPSKWQSRHQPSGLRALEGFVSSQVTAQLWLPNRTESPKPTGEHITSTSTSTNSTEFYRKSRSTASIEYPLFIKKCNGSDRES